MYTYSQLERNIEWTQRQHKNAKIQSQFKYQSNIYNVQRSYVVNHSGKKMRRNKKLFPSLNFINGKTSPYASKGIIRHYYYWSDPSLGPGIVETRTIPCSCHDCTNIPSISWNYKTR